MRTLSIASSETLDFETRKDLAEASAARLLGEPMLLSWYDSDRAIESPRGVSECHDAEPTEGVRAYAASRGGALCVSFSADLSNATLFCFRDNAAD